MPLLRNKFQPYFPDPDSPNRYQCGSEQYCWPVQLGDRVMSQFYQTPCNDNLVCDPEFDDFSYGPELILNGSFTGPTPEWSVGANWIATGTNIYHNPGSTALLQQFGVPIVDCDFFWLQVTVSRISGTLTCVIGLTTLVIDSTGVFEIKDFYASGSNTLSFVPSSDFEGYIDNVTVRLINYDCWDSNCAWILDGNKACKRVGVVGQLVQTGSNYINTGSYYKYEISVTNISNGQLYLFLAGTLFATITTNGDYLYYLTATNNGTISFSSSLDFDGCISEPKVYELRNDYTAELIDSNGTIYDVSDSISYYNEFVTIDLGIEDYELSDGCYTLNVYDYCIVTSDNLVIDGDFVNGYTNWLRNNPASQYDDTGDQMKFIFTPFSIGDTDYITNGDFSGGTTGWTFGAGWSLVGGKARHTAGNTATLFQTMTLPTPPLGTNYNYWVKFTVSNWTVGTVNLKLGNAATGTNYTWKGNDIFLQIYQPKQAGSVNITFTPSSNFDGDIDDIAVVRTNHSAFPFITNTTNPLFTPGNYQTDWEIIGSSDSNIKVRAQLLNAIPVPNYESVAGVYSYSQAYTLTGGAVQVIANFSKTSPNYVQYNYVEGDITVDNISAVKTEPFEATFTSECINYSTSNIPRSKVIIGYCDQNALGFEFENTGFKLMHRAEIRSLNPTYPSTSEIMKTSRGNDRFVYGELQKYWNVSTDFASETFHDTMAAILICDHVQMGDTQGDTIEYSTEGSEYSPEWNAEGAYSLATAQFQLRVKEKGQVFNRHI